MAGVIVNLGKKGSIFGGIIAITAQLPQFLCQPAEQAIDDEESAHQHYGAAWTWSRRLFYRPLDKWFFFFRWLCGYGEWQGKKKGYPLR